MKNYLATISLLLLPFLLMGQTSKIITGKVVEVSEEGEIYPLIGANVFWLDRQVGAVTDENGEFLIGRIDGTSQLVISYIGFKSDTINAEGKDYIGVTLEATILLDGVEVVHRRKSTEISLVDPIKVETIGERELLKAACCNLSESFETSPSIDVSFTDAVTGTRQIQLLGLAGTYSQITRENLPEIRGLAGIYGLTYTPGTWIESIQLNKGAGSVVNGFESISGQINIELRKPESAESMYLNFYANEGGRLEANANFAHRFPDGTWSTALLIHGKTNSSKHDRNKDGFLDKPLSDQFIALNRWKFIGDDGWLAQAGIKASIIDNQGGQVDFSPVNDAGTTNNWGMRINTQRYDAWMKIGKVFVDMPWKTFGLQLNGSHHDQDSYFGLNDYDAIQKSFYANFIYQSIIGNTNQTFKAGLSFQYDDYTEVLNSSDFSRVESAPGAYFEYAHGGSSDFNFVAGIRGDLHNNYGFFITPRLHVRKAFAENSVLRGSVGRGLKTANIIAENSGLLASSRAWEISTSDQDNPYGLDAEVAWNYGINFTQKFMLDFREGALSFDFYRTDFENQIVVDVDSDPQKVTFYNLDGSSYSNSFQVQLDYEAIKRLDVRLAYRWYDVKTTYAGDLLKKPLVANHRAFINLAYNTRDSWSFDYTLNWQGKKRIPFTASNPEEFRLAGESPNFFLMNAQVSKNWNEKFELYVGAENILGYKQENPIISSEDPFGTYFDSSLVWGPLFGRNVYFGVRYRVK